VDAGPDALADHYSSLADDSSRGRLEREAAVFLSIAEEHLEDEDGERAHKAAEQAVAAFKKLDDERAVADAQRAAIRARCLKEERHGAYLAAKVEMELARKKGNKRGEASMMLSVAEVALDHMGSKHREDALKAALDARDLFQELGDEKMEAASSLVAATIHIKKAAKMGHLSSELRAALERAGDARTLFRKAGDKKGEVRSLHSMAVACTGLGNFKDSFQHSEKALAMSRELGDAKAEAVQLCMIAQAYLKKGEPQEALTSAEKALEIVREIGDGVRWELLPMQTVVQAYVANGDIDEALDAAYETLDRFQRSKDKKLEVATLFTIVDTHLGSDNVEGARAVAERAERALFIIGNDESLARLYFTGTNLFFRRNQPERSLLTAEAALKLFQKLGHVEEEISALQILAEVLAATGSGEAALATAQGMRDLCLREEDRNGEAISLMTTCNVHFMSNQLDEAVEAAGKAQKIYRQERDTNGEADATHTLAMVYQEKGSYFEAHDEAKRAVSLRDQLGDKHGVVHTLVLKADIELMTAVHDDSKAGTSQLEAALQTAKEALSQARRLSDNQLNITALYMLAQVDIVSGRSEDALRAINEGMAICQEIEDEHDEGRLLVLASYAALYNKDNEKALEEVNKALELLRKCGDLQGEAFAQECLEKVKSKMYVPPKPQHPEMQQQQQDAPLAGAASEALAAPTEYQGPDAAMLVRKLQGMVKDMFDVDELENDTMLMDIGIDSLSMLDFHARIAKEIPGVSWSPTMLFDHPTLQELGDMMEETLQNAFKNKR